MDHGVTLSPAPRIIVPFCSTGMCNTVLHRLLESLCLAFITQCNVTKQSTRMCNTVLHRLFPPNLDRIALFPILLTADTIVHCLRRCEGVWGRIVRILRIVRLRETDLESAFGMIQTASQQNSS